MKLNLFYFIKPKDSRKISLEAFLLKSFNRLLGNLVRDFVFVFILFTIFFFFFFSEIQQENCVEITSRTLVDAFFYRGNFQRCNVGDGEFMILTDVTIPIYRLSRVVWFHN